MPAAERTPRLSRQRRLFLIAALAGLAVFVLVAVLMRTGALDGFDARVVDFVASHHRRQPFTGIAETLDRLDTWWLLHRSSSPRSSAACGGPAGWCRPCTWA